MIHLLVLGLVPVLLPVPRLLGQVVAKAEVVVFPTASAQLRQGFFVALRARRWKHLVPFEPGRSVVTCTKYDPCSW